jgi:oxalate decarboxylase
MAAKSHCIVQNRKMALAGNARITAVDNDGLNFVADVGPGDLWYFPGGIPHSIQGLPDEGCEFLLAFPDGEFSEDSTFAISDLLAHTPRDVLAKDLSVPVESLGQISKEELFIFQADLCRPCTRTPCRIR